LIRLICRGAAVAVLSVAFSGISGCEVPSGDALIAAQDYVNALINRDGQAACARLSPAQRVALQSSSHSSCARAVLLNSPDPAVLGAEKIVYPEVAGNSAFVVEIARARPPVFVRLIDSGGRWLVDGQQLQLPGVYRVLLKRLSRNGTRITGAGGSAPP
jgi:hypothetical protein